MIALSFGSFFAVSASANPVVEVRLPPLAQPIGFVINCVSSEGGPLECVADAPCLEPSCCELETPAGVHCPDADALKPKLILCKGGGSTLIGMETKLAGVHFMNEPGSSYWSVLYNSGVAPWQQLKVDGHLRTPLHSITVVANDVRWTFSSLPIVGTFHLDVVCTPNPLNEAQGLITSAHHDAAGTPILPDFLDLIELKGSTCVTAC